MDVAPVVHPSVQAAVEDYIETLDQRMALQQLEPDKRDLLINLMQQHECARCIVNGKTVVLEHLFKIVTKKNRADE